jgi:PAS domain S-box-containing protein
MNFKSKSNFYIAIINLAIFMVVKLMVFIEVIPSNNLSRVVELICLLIFTPLFWNMYKDLRDSYKLIKKNEDYNCKLNKALVLQSNTDLYYAGDTVGASKVLTKTVGDILDTDRVSVWLYNAKRDTVVLQNLYLKAKDEYVDKALIYKSDFKPYFKALDSLDVIVANDVHTHPATACLSAKYLIPNGIMSMLDVPLWYDNEVIGVICIESLVKREWQSNEIDFVQILSSLYSFAYSVHQTNEISNDLVNFERFVDKAALVSKADEDGRITYINKKFEEVSGYKSKELVGKDYNILSSGFHNKKFWDDMYKATVTNKKIWNGIIVNKKKNGELYYVDCYIKADFDLENRLTGYMTIRYDVTELINTLQEINKKNTYLEHAAKIIRHDMHSGINVYIPRGISSLKRRLTAENIKKLKLENPLKLLEEGLIHTQRVYQGVYEFTNLVKKDSVLNKAECDLHVILKKFLSNTSYSDQVLLSGLPVLDVNESLFCTAIDNLIRNGLKYNDSKTKFVKIFMEGDNTIVVQDNGRGMTQQEFNQLSKPYTRKLNQKETGTGLGLNICVAILSEHGFKVSCEKNDIGTKITIKVKE